MEPDSTCAQVAKNVRLLCNWQDTANAPALPGGQHWNDVWGFVAHGREYAVIGGTVGAHIIDVDNCKERAFLPGVSQGTVHRDYKTYSHYLYCVADEGRSALQVFDFNYLPDSLHLVYQSDPNILGKAHNIFIDTSKARLYFASEYSFGSGHNNIQVYSLKQPEKPEYIASINAFANTHDLYVRNDTAWCSNGSSGYLALDMSHLPSHDVIGGLLYYVYMGFNHSSWMGYDYIGVMADETFGMPVKVIDAKKPGTIRVLSTFGPRGDDSTSVPHNPYLLGHYAFVSYYQDGLQIYDLADPRNPIQAGYYHTFPQPNGQKYAGAWGCFPYLPSRRILVSDMQTGLYVLDADLAMKINKEAHFSIYPNPVGPLNYLQLPFGTSGHFTGIVYSVTGAVVAKMEGEISGEANPPMELSLPIDLRPGWYFMRAMIGGEVFTARFLKR